MTNANKFGNFDKIDNVMCAIKKHLYLLARYFADTVGENSPETIMKLTETAGRSESFYNRDEKLIAVAKYYRDEYTYTQLKRIKDNSSKEFEKLYAAIK